MARGKKEKFVEIVPKTEVAKQKLDYHGNKWLLRERKDVVKFSRDTGWLVLRSRDGSKCMLVKEIGDVDFTVRILQ